MEVVLKVCRFDPAKGPSPFFQEFALTVPQNLTVLDCLLLACRQDPTLSFRRSCRSGICGSCAIRINGEPALACQTLVNNATAKSSVITLEPLPRFKPLKDLVVDLDPFFESLKATLPWLILRQGYDGRMSPEVARKLESPATCILCGVCKAVLDEEGQLNPAGVVKALRLAQDPRDAIGMDRIRLLDVPPQALKPLLSTLKRTCPKGITVADVV